MSKGDRCERARARERENRYTNENDWTLNPYKRTHVYYIHMCLRNKLPSIPIVLKLICIAYLPHLRIAQTKIYHTFYMGERTAPYMYSKLSNIVILED